MSQEHKKALRVLMKSPVTDDMIKFLTHTTSKVLPGNSIPTPPGSPTDEKEQKLPSLMTFITRLVRYTNVYTSTLLTTACYLNKLQRSLPKGASGLPSTIHRMFLACLIISAKYHNDSSPLNKHWAEYTDGLFTLEDINLMEVQLLALLNWDLRINEDDLILDLRHLLEPIMRDLETSYQRRRYNKMKLEYQQQQQLLQPYSSAGTVYNKNLNKLYNSNVNGSVDSNLSSVTLIDTNDPISRSSSRSQVPNTCTSSPLHEKTPVTHNISNVNKIHRYTSSTSSDGNSNWDFEEIMVQYGF